MRPTVRLLLAKLWTARSRNFTVPCSQFGVERTRPPSTGTPVGDDRVSAIAAPGRPGSRIDPGSGDGPSRVSVNDDRFLGIGHVRRQANTAVSPMKWYSPRGLPRTRSTAETPNQTGTGRRRPHHGALGQTVPARFGKRRPAYRRFPDGATTTHDHPGSRTKRERDFPPSPEVMRPLDRRAF